jgi:uncharacterized protein UPF0547
MNGTTIAAIIAINAVIIAGILYWAAGGSIRRVLHRAPSQRVTNEPVGSWPAASPAAPVSPARSLSERMNHPSFAGIVVATLLIAVPFVGFIALVVDVVMILRYLFGYRAPGSAEWSIHHPSSTSLAVVWIVSVLTVVVYPLAIYMTYRYVVERQDRSRGASKVCPRCAEAVKAAALVCRHCGHEFEIGAARAYV